MKFLAKITVMLKKDVADVQGNAIQQSLARHNKPISAVRAGKFFEVELEAAGETAARAEVEKLANGTFSNPVIEHYWYEVEEK